MEFRGFLWLIILSALFLPLLYTLFRQRRRSAGRRAIGLSPQSLVIGFFHPYCNAGGGGERVLFAAVSQLLREDPRVVCVIYTGDQESKDTILFNAKSRFGIEIDSKRVYIINLRFRRLVEASTWPIFTLIGQSLGSAYLCWEALRLLEPDVFFETMGYSFAFPVIKLFFNGIATGSYTHYPTISHDMLERVLLRQSGHTNPSRISQSFVLSYGKYVYYKIFIYLYCVSLRMCDVLMTNSSWTYAHITSLVGPSKDVLKVYPPCDTVSLSALPLQPREKLIVSVAQFRPEKEHEMQIRAFAKYLEKNQDDSETKFIMTGGARNEADKGRVDRLNNLIRELDLENRISIVVNIPYNQLVEMLGKATIGLHTMIDEHFGITVVEFMVAGCIALAHASAGPLLDIIVPYDGQPTGYHARTVNEFSDCLETILSKNTLEVHAMQERARRSATERFSVEQFERGFWEGYSRVIKLHRQ